MSCLRRTGCVVSKLFVVEGVSLFGPLVQSIRGIKPRWLPKSKSKIFYVRTPTEQDPEEAETLRTMYFRHRTDIRAIRKLLMDQHAEKLRVVQQHSATEDLDSASEFHHMEEIVSQWNNQAEEVRINEWAKEKERQERQSRKWMERNQRRIQQRLQKAQDRISLDLDASKSFITMENLDMEIEKLLNVYQDYNFAVNKQGSRISESSEKAAIDQQAESTPVVHSAES